MDYLLFFAGAGLVLLAAYFVANAVYRRLRKGGSKLAVLLYVITFLVSVFLIGFILLLILVANVRLER